MTKQLDAAKGAGDRPVLDVCFKEFKRFNHSRMEVTKFRKKGLPLKGLSVSKAYLERRLVVCAWFEAIAKSNSRSIAACYECDVANSSATLEKEFVNLSFLLGRQEDHMLVGNVENMEAEQVLALPARERLYLIENTTDDFVAGAATCFGMSIDGTFKILPRAFFGEGELDMLVDNSAIGFDQDAVRVVEGGAKVMKRITENRGSVLREPTSNRGAFPRITIILRSDGFSVLTNVASEDAYQLRDVLIGPFGL